jgi:hypothetical protein
MKLCRAQARSGRFQGEQAWWVSSGHIAGAVWRRRWSAGWPVRRAVCPPSPPRWPPWRRSGSSQVRRLVCPRHPARCSSSRRSQAFFERFRFLRVLAHPRHAPLHSSRTHRTAPSHGMARIIAEPARLTLYTCRRCAVQGPDARHHRARHSHGGPGVLRVTHCGAPADSAAGCNGCRAAAPERDHTAGAS